MEAFFDKVFLLISLQCLRLRKSCSSIYDDCYFVFALLITEGLKQNLLGLYSGIIQKCFVEEIYTKIFH